MSNKPRFPTVKAPQFDVGDLAPVDHLTLESESIIDGIVTADITINEDAKYVEIIGSRLANAQLTASVFDDLSMVDVIVDDCDLSGATFASTKLLRVQFNHCRMSGFDASGLKAQDVVFNNCKLDDANFRMSSWERSQFIECQMQGTEFNAAKLKQSQLIRCNLERVQFAQAKLSNVALHGSNLDGIGGAESLKGAVIGADQVLPLANQLLATLGIEVDDDVI